MQSYNRSQSIGKINENTKARYGAHSPPSFFRVFVFSCFRDSKTFGSTTEILTGMIALSTTA
jgi:hypothetical protein